jgi:threonine dehydrogenase-like Zn-dependent dehydrogenase
MNMLAARYLGPNRLEPIEIPMPVLSEEEALLKVVACGFCGSDLSIVSGMHPRAKAPLTLGHEFCGTIAEIRGTNSPFQEGDLVTAIPLISCGHCYACRNGMPHVCRTLRLYGFDADGAMAEFVRLPVGSILKLPANLSGLVGAVIEPLAVAVHGVSLAPIDSASTAVVIGAGPIGLLTALVAKSRGVPSVVISDILPSRLALARKLGLRTAIAGEGLQELVNQETAGDGADLVFECVGAPSTGQAMTKLVRSRGTIVDLGVFKKPVEIDMQSVNFKEIILRGSRVYTRRDFESAICLAQNLPIREIVTSTFPLQDVQAAFECFRKGSEVCKVLILPNGATE